MNLQSTLGRSGLVFLVVASCRTVGPDYTAPELPVALADTPALEALVEPTGQVDLAAWWQAFDDPVLTGLIEEALADSLELSAAFARIAEAEAVLGVERASTKARADLTGAFTRTGISENTQFGLFPGQDRTTDDITIGVGASWELDLWGRKERIIEAARADFEVRLEELSAVRVSLAARVGDAYLRLRELQRRRGIAEQNLAALVESLSAARTRYDAGLVERLDVLQSEAQLERARADLPGIDLGIARTMSELESLVGRTPGTLGETLRADAPKIPSPSGRLGGDVSADLLRRRPDLRTAERRLAAQTARVGIAEAELYPRLSLGFNLGLESELLENLPKATSLIHSMGPSLSMPLFSGGALRDNVRANEARVEESLIDYRATLLAALHEVETAARAVALEGQRQAALETARKASEVSLENASVRYREGLTPVDTVLDAQRSLYAILDARTTARAAQARAYIDLYRALGGGWSGDKQEP